MFKLCQTSREEESEEPSRSHEGVMGDPPQMNATKTIQKPSKLQRTLDLAWKSFPIMAKANVKMQTLTPNSIPCISFAGCWCGQIRTPCLSIFNALFLCVRGLDATESLKRRGAHR